MNEVTLRPITLKDAKYFVKFLKDDGDAINMMSHQLFPCTQKNAEKWIKDRSSDKENLFAIIKNKDTFVGVIGFGNVDSDDFGVGYWVGKPFRNQGIATTALLIIQKHAKEMGLKKLTASTVPENFASIKALKKAGFIYKEISKVNFSAVGNDLDLAHFTIDIS